MTTANITSTLARDTYGALHHSMSINDTDRALYSAALKLTLAAAKYKKIPTSFDGMEWGSSGKEKGKKIGDALHHEIYDISPDGRIVLVCCRAVSGDRYGQKTTGKEYFLVRAHGAGVRVLPANKAIAAKAAKSAGPVLGVAIAVCSGKQKLTTAPMKKRIGYKAVAYVGGELKSIFSAEKYTLGTRKADAVADDHGGGYYFYASPEEACRAEVPNASALINEKRVILKCEMSGRGLAYGSKLAASYIRPIEIIASVI